MSKEVAGLIEKDIAARTRAAMLFLYSVVGKMREETYRTVLEPRRCLDNVEDIGHRAQMLTRDLYHLVRGD